MRDLFRATQEDPRTRRIKPRHDFFNWQIAARRLIPTLTHLDVSSVDLHVIRIPQGEPEKPFRLKQRMTRQAMGEKEAMPVELPFEQGPIGS
jgi:hypothetical protein